MRSSSPARTPKLQLAAEQPSTGKCWIPPKKDIPHPRAKEKTQRVVGGVKSRLESNSIHLNAEFQRIVRRDKKAFLSDQCKEIEENNRMGKTRDLFKKIEIPREHFMQRWTQ